MKRIAIILTVFFIAGHSLLLAQVQPTNEWVSIWSDSSYIGNSKIPIGAVIRAYDPQNVLCGEFTAVKSGSFGLMPVYKDDSQTQRDEGATAGDTIRFTVDERPAIVYGPDPPVWTTNGGVLRINLVVQDTSQPLIRVYPGLISFGTVALKDSVTRTIRVVNIGLDSLAVDSIVAVYRFPSHFSISPSTFRLPPGDSINVTVQYKATLGSGNITPDLLIYSNAENVPIQRVPMTANIETDVIPTNEWINVWSDSALYDGSVVEIGDVIDVFDPQGVHCGTFVVSKANQYGIVPVYRDDPLTTSTDEGAAPGDTLRFTINGYTASTLGPDQPIWRSSGQVLKVRLSALPSASRAVISVVPSTLTFGSIMLKGSAARSCVIRNEGPDTVTIYSTDVIYSFPEHFYVETTSNTIPPDTSVTITVDYTAVVGEGEIHATLVVYSNASNFPRLEIPMSALVLTGGISTNEWISLWSDSTVFNGRLVEPGDVIDVYDPDSILCGSYTVQDTGKYGLLHVYRDDSYSDSVDEGASPGDTLSFNINGYPAISNGPDSPVWTANGNILNINLVPDTSQPLSLNVGPDVTICKGVGSVVGRNAYGGRPPYNYTWTPAMGLNNPKIARPFANPDSQTTYVITVIDARSDTVRDTLSVAVNLSPEAHAGPDKVICSGANTVIGDTATGGVPPYSYSWSPSSGLNKSDIARPTASPGATTVYVVTVTAANNCVDSDTVIVFVNSGPTAKAGPDTTICYGASVSIGDSASGGAPPYSYLWDPVEGLSARDVPRPTAGPDTTTAYIVTVTDANGCTGSDTVRVIINSTLAANAGFDIDLCIGSEKAIGDTVTGGTPPYTYSWSPSTGLSATNVLKPVANPSTGTTYTLLVTDSKGCTASDSTIVTVHQLPAVTARPDTTIWSGDVVELIAEGSGGTEPYGYEWSPGSTLDDAYVARPNAGPLTSQKYHVTLNDYLGCQAVDSLVVTVKPVQVYPPDSSKGHATSLTLRWHSLSASSYDLQISTNESFLSPLMTKGGITDTSLTVSDLDYEKTYYWRIRAHRNSDVNNWCFPWNFGTTLRPPPLLSPLDGAFNVARTPTLKWKASPLASFYRLWLSTDSTFASVNIYEDSLSSSEYTCSQLSSNARYFWKVRAVNQSDSATSAVWSFTTFKMPDLQVTQVQVPGTAWSGQTFQVTWHVSNTGTGETRTPVWYDKLYLSPDTSFDPDVDTFLGIFENISYLDTAQSYSNTATFTLANGISGNYYVFVQTDNRNQIEELDENNNMSRNSSAMQVSISPYPDLQVSLVTAPGNAFSGAKINVNWTVGNTGGTGPTKVSTWVDSIYLSRDTILDFGSDIPLGRKAHTGILQLDSTYSTSDSVTLPQKQYGKFWILVFTDATNAVYEYASENNNTGYSADTIHVTLTPPPDLIVTSITIPDSAGTLEPISIGWTVKNSGPGAPFESGWSDRVYISKSAAFHQDSVIDLGSFAQARSLDPDSTYVSNNTVPLPDKISGRYFVYVKTDCDDEVFEHDYNDNNISRSDTSILILAPDLVITGISVPDTAVSGKKLELSWSIKNQGAGKLRNKPWKDKVYLTRLAYLNLDSVTVLGEENRSRSLAVDSSFSTTRSYTLPRGISGHYFVFIETDIDNNVFEDGRDDNNLTRTDSSFFVELAGYPDLVVTSVTIPDSASLGDSISISWTVKNQGNDTLRESHRSDRIYFSRDTSISADTALVLFSIDRQDTLRPDSSTTVQAKFVLPATVVGSFYTFVETDAFDVVYEYLHSDNNMRRSDSTTYVRWPDLQAVFLDVPDSIKGGERVLLEGCVTNSGGGPTPIGGSWVDVIYLSKDSTWNEDASTALVSIPRAPRLKPGERDTIKVQVAIPNDVSGKRYFYFMTDESNSIFENGQESNNVIRSDSTSGSSGGGVVVESYPPPDIAVTAYSAPSSASSGDTIRVSWTVRNLGSGTTRITNWNDRVYIALDTLPETLNDISLLSVSRREALHPGLSYSRDTLLTLPDTISGQWYLIVKTDASNLVQNDSIPGNNVRKSAISVQLSAHADLAVTSVTMDSTVASVQPVMVHWSVANTGSGVTNTTSWYDAVYISGDTLLDAGDRRIGTYMRNDTLSPGASYSDSLEVVIPEVSGPHYVFVKSDYSNRVFESGKESNNEARFPVSVTTPPPADLIVLNVTAPDSTVPGESITISWTLKNIGSNKAKGLLRDAIYLSVDTVWSVSDPMVGKQDRIVNIPPGGTLFRSMDIDVAHLIDADEQGNTPGETGFAGGRAPLPLASLTEKTPAIVEGSYYCLVRTDIRNTIYESSNANNTGRSDSVISVSVPLLTPDTTVSGMLKQGEKKYYRFNTSFGQTLVLSLKSSDNNAANELYLRYGEAPTRSLYDYGTNKPFSPDQEISVSSTEDGVYYVMLFANSLSGGSETYELSIRSVKLEILSVHSNKGGNTGRVTLKITGSRFDNNTFFMLKKCDNTDSVLNAKIQYINSSSVFCTFYLDGAGLGLYNLKCRDFSGNSFVLDSSFTVEKTKIQPLGFQVSYPERILVNRAGMISVYFKNKSNIDVKNPLLLVRADSRSGTSVGRSIDELRNNWNEIGVVLMEEGMDDAILRPEAEGNVYIYVRTERNGGFVPHEALKFTIHEIEY